MKKTLALVLLLTALPAFAHPRRCVYVLGAEDHGLSPAQRAACHRLIVVPGAAHCLNVATAGSIVLYDRIQRRGHPDGSESEVTK